MTVVQKLFFRFVEEVNSTPKIAVLVPASFAPNLFWGSIYGLRDNCMAVLINHV